MMIHGNNARLVTKSDPVEAVQYKIYYIRDVSEYVAYVFYKGQDMDKDKGYHTDDKADAFSTCEIMRKGLEAEYLFSESLEQS